MIKTRGFASMMKSQALRLLQNRVEMTSTYTESRFWGNRGSSHRSSVAKAPRSGVDSASCLGKRPSSLDFEL